jgi:NADH-quinone oxidoreductase subunit L
MASTLSPELIFPLVPWVVFLPVIGLVVNLLIGRWLGEKFAGWWASLASAGSFMVALLLALALSQSPESQVIHLARWFSIGTLNLGWDFRIDTLSVWMMLIVSGVGTIIHIYSIGYMHADVRHNGDPGRYVRFFVYLNLFIAAMMTLVSANNFLMLFVGWEGVGLCSYLLIGFWFEKGVDGIGNARAAKKAFVVNRIGDFGLLIAIFLMAAYFGSLDFDTVFQAAAGTGMQGVVLAVTLFMLLAVAGKSAQLPLFVWLPDAMAGPTPVSALIHAATMVTAGVYLVARSQVMYIAAPLAGQVAVYVGAVTALFAATIAVGQFDIKKVLAYSTISQLGFMVAAVGMGAVTAGMFHLTTHAFFKALLFLAAGSVILGMESRAHSHSENEGHLAESASGKKQISHSGVDPSDPQDMRNMGGLWRRMPVTFAVYLVGGLALVGIPPLAGFFSKDEIIAAASRYDWHVFTLLLIAAFLTAFYVGRQILLIFFGSPRSQHAKNAVENPGLITVPLLILAVLSLLGGEANAAPGNWLSHWLERTLPAITEGEFTLWVALLSVGLGLTGLFSAWLVYGLKTRKNADEEDVLHKLFGVIFTGMNRKWLVDELYHYIVIVPYQFLAGLFAGPVDQGVIDGSVNGIGKITMWTGNLLRKLQNGYVRTYALIFFTGVVIILTILVLR